jgi:hypothetical protein
MRSGRTTTWHAMNNPTVAIAGLVLVGIIAVAIIENNRADKAEAALAGLAKEQSALERKFRDLSRLMAEARDRQEVIRPSAPAPVAPGETTVRAPEPRNAAAASPPEAPPPVPGVSRVAPAGWAKNGSAPGAYLVGVDQNETFQGLPSAYVQSIDPAADAFGGMMQMNSAENFVGKRVRLSGWVKTENANDGGGHLWLRVDGSQRGTPLQFDNMNRSPVKGTTEWQQYSVVLDVPPEASALAYGFFVEGAGKMWVNGAKLEPVGPEVASTNMLSERPNSAPKAPVNLNFDPNHPK